ncbi:MAG TPA: type II toxin-antitoxin system VapB family antitoxin [Thermoanaerobaculia bacterium]|nr:type II toxin-antitoxin system VapB family antitoxin [Thermoanaerobaculia bacterium]
MAIAKLFWNGRSQAVRLPKDFRFDGTEVRVERDGDKVILEPVPRRRWPKGYFESWGRVPSDFDVPAPLPSKPELVDLDD